MLVDDAIHLWVANLAMIDVDTQARMAKLLNLDELQRARRFVFDRDCRRFTNRRAILRHLLGGYLALPPQEIRFEAGRNGKLSLAKVLDTENLYFNLSHSEELILMGFTRAGPIGVDIEYCHPLPATSGVIAKALSTKEYRHYQATPTTCREALFYAAWTLKEAGVKATGKGLSGLEEIDLNISATAGKASLRAIGGHVANPGGWYSRTFAAVKGFASAVVVEGDPKSCYLYTIGGID